MTPLIITIWLYFSCLFPVQRRPHRIGEPAVAAATRGNVACCLRAVWAAKKSCIAVYWGIVQPSTLLLLQPRHRHLLWPVPLDPGGTLWYSLTEISFYSIQPVVSFLVLHVTVFHFIRLILFPGGSRKGLWDFTVNINLLGAHWEIYYMSPPGFWQQATSEACQGLGGLPSSQLRAACLLQRWDHSGHSH